MALYTPSYKIRENSNLNAEGQSYKAAVHSLQAPSLLKAHLCEVLPKLILA